MGSFSYDEIYDTLVERTRDLKNFKEKGLKAISEMKKYVISEEGSSSLSISSNDEKVYTAIFYREEDEHDSKASFFFSFDIDRYEDTTIKGIKKIIIQVLDELEQEIKKPANNKK